MGFFSSRGRIKKISSKKLADGGGKEKRGKKANFYAVNPKSKNQSNLHAKSISFFPAISNFLIKERNFLPFNENNFH